MMILTTFRIGAVGALLCGLAAPAAAADRDRSTRAAPSHATARADASNRAAHSRRVELPFLLDFRAPQAQPPRPARRESTAPHPYRELQLEETLRASLEAGGFGGVRLSPRVDFG